MTITMKNNLPVPTIPGLLRTIKEQLGFPANADLVFDFRKFQISEKMYCKLTKEYRKGGQKDPVSESFLFNVRSIFDMKEDELAFDAGFIKGINIYVLESEEDGRHEEPQVFYSERERDQEFERLSGFTRAQVDSGEYDEHLDTINEEGWIFRISSSKIK